MTFEEQVRQYKLTKAYYDCENVAGRWAYYCSAFMTEDILSLWSAREDICLSLPFGQYIGPRSIQRYHCKALGDRNDPTACAKLLGTMCLSTLDTPAIEIAGDMATARGLWFSPRVETYGEAASCKTFCGHGFWMWSKLAIDFIFEDGQWKLWHVWIHQVFRTDYYKSWTSDGEYLGFAFGDPLADKPPRIPFRPYRSDERPEPGPTIPVPYDCFSQVFPGYGLFPTTEATQ